MSSPYGRFPGGNDAYGMPPGRPGKVTAISIIFGVIGVLGVLFSLLAYAGINELHKQGKHVNGALPALVTVALVIYCLEIVTSIFVWQGRSWARIMGVVLCAVTVITGVVSLVMGSGASIFSLVLSIVLLVLLNSRDVIAWCRGTTGR